MKVAALILVAVSGGSIALAIHLRRRWIAREAAEKAQIDGLIHSPNPVFGKLPANEYDDLRAEAARRHAAVSYRQKQSAQIASGEKPPEAKRIEIVR